MRYMDIIFDWIIEKEKGDAFSTNDCRRMLQSMNLTPCPVTVLKALTRLSKYGIIKQDGYIAEHVRGQDPYRWVVL